MSFRRISFSAPLVVLFVAIVVAAACATGKGKGGGGGGGADAARGAKYFAAKCNACHPSGGVGAGPALLGKTPPGPIKKSSAGGRHNVPDDEYESLIAYITPIMMPGAAAAAVAVPAAATAPAVAAPAGTAPAMAPAAGTKTCNCTCQCPVGTPAGQMSQCTCQCSCPAG